MGYGLISLYQEKVKKEWKIAFWAAFISFLLIHLYKIVNYLPNHDTLYNFYAEQRGIGNGRWFLQYACGISSYFDLPWVNGLLCAVYFGITAVVVTAFLEIRNPVIIILAAGILTGTPSTTETLFFGYTADGYILGLAMAAVSACLSCQKGSIKQYFLSGVLLCLSCGIYQSCISFAIMCCICYLVLQLLDGKISIRDAWRWIGRHVILYAAAMVSYYVIWKIILYVQGVTAISYQGIDSVGEISVSTLLSSCVQSVANLITFFVEWNILENPISLYAVLNIVFLLCFVAITVIAIVKSNTYRNASHLAMVLLCLVASVPALYIWNFLSPGVVYRPMMLHGVCLYYILALILFDKWGPSLASTAFGAMVAIMVFNFAIMANTSYFWLNKCYEKTYYWGSQIMNTVVATQLENDDIVKVAFIGDRQQEVWHEDSLYTQKVHILNMCLEEDLLYDHVHTYLFLENTFGLEIPCASDAELESLGNLPQVQQMPVWPAAGSCEVIDGTLVIRIGE